jgi:hypothetical protein
VREGHDRKLDFLWKASNLWTVESSAVVPYKSLRRQFGAN